MLSEAEYKRLQLACAHETRDPAIIELLLQTGMRLSELARLSIGSFELPVKISRDEGHVGSVHIHGKGRKDRTITLNWKACKAIRSYLAVRPKVEDPRLFITKFGAGISPRAIEDVVAKYLKGAGVANASVHTPRHTFGTHMAKKGIKPESIRHAMGSELPRLGGSSALSVNPVAMGLLRRGIRPSTGRGARWGIGDCLGRRQEGSIRATERFLTPPECRRTAASESHGSRSTPDRAPVGWWGGSWPGWG